MQPAPAPLERRGKGIARDRTHKAAGADTDILCADLDDLVRCTPQHGACDNGAFVFLAVERLDLRRHDRLTGLPLPDGLAVVLILCIIFARYRAERDGLGVGDRAARTDVQAVGQSLKNRLRLACKTTLRNNAVHMDLLHEIRAAVSLRGIKPLDAVEQGLCLLSIMTYASARAVDRDHRKRVQFTALFRQRCAQRVLIEKFTKRRTHRAGAQREGKGIGFAGRCRGARLDLMHRAGEHVRILHKAERPVSCQNEHALLGEERKGKQEARNEDQCRRGGAASRECMYDGACSPSQRGIPDKCNRTVEEQRRTDKHVEQVGKNPEKKR